MNRGALIHSGVDLPIALIDQYTPQACLLLRSAQALPFQVSSVYVKLIKPSQQRKPRRGRLVSHRVCSILSTQ